jgi:hypothetical protein
MTLPRNASDVLAGRYYFAKDQDVAVIEFAKGVVSAFDAPVAECQG